MATKGLTGAAVFFFGDAVVEGIDLVTLLAVPGSNDKNPTMNETPMICPGIFVGGKGAYWLSSCAGVN